MLKELGQVFTPPIIVEKMFNISKIDDCIFTSKILEPSFGEGAFLLPIIEKIIVLGRKNKKTDDEILDIIQDNIYGVELDNTLFNKTQEAIKDLLKKYNLEDDIVLNLYNQDFLDFNIDDFDFIIGNPPYIRIHNIDEKTRKKIKNFEFSTGNTDLYIIFFEKCIKLLNEKGKLIFITPNSFIRNTSQKNFRNFLCKNKLIKEIIDFGSNKIFKNADTYTAITFLSKENDKESFLYKRSDGINILEERKILFSKDWFGSKNDGDNLGNICQIQYGFATNADKIFISDNFDDLEDGILHNIVKGSRIDSEKVQKVIFPYKKENGKYIAFSEEELKTKFPKAYKYLLSHKEELEKRSLENNTLWFEFARSQSIQAVDSKKLVIKHVIKNDQENIVYKIVPPGTCVYSGLYITVSDDNFEKIEEIIKDASFINHLKENGKDMSGGYKSFNTKAVKNYKTS